MDHMMPRMDGVETVKQIRELGYSSPIVALTANAVVGQDQMFLSSGFDGFISKPIDIRQLDDLLKKMIRDKHK
jgi:CheY-like chemotaxis protein